MKKTIVPSVIAKSQEELDDRIEAVGPFAKLLQLDFFDGQFVPTHAFEFDFKLPGTHEYEADLLIKNPDKWIEKYVHYFKTILVHWMTVQDPEKLIDQVRKQGQRVGFALDHDVPFDVIKPYVHKIDQLLVMTGKAGFYGSPFQPELLEKVRQARKLRPELDIEVDVGIDDNTIKMASDAGANMFVSGSYITKDNDVKGAIDKLLSLTKG